MGRFLNLLRSGARRNHLPMEELVEWADGFARRSTDHHLRRCAVCHAQGLRIRRAAQNAHTSANQGGHAPALAVVFERLQAHMLAWPRAWRHGPRGPAHASLTRTIELYFGREAANRMTRAAGGDAPEQRLFLATKSMCSAFLGAAAADAIAEHIAGAEC